MCVYTAYICSRPVYKVVLRRHAYTFNSVRAGNAGTRVDFAANEEYYSKIALCFKCRGAKRKIRKTNGKKKEKNPRAH